MNYIKKKWSRRDFLRAAGLGTAAASMLHYVPALALEGAPAPKRVVFFTTPLGSRILNGWRPTLAHGESITPGSLGTILDPLSGYADKMLLVEGLDMGPTYYGTSDVRMDGHNARSCLWTGANLYPVDACAGQGYIGFAEGHSLDREIQNAWGLDLSRLHTVAMGKPGCIESRAVSYYEAAGSPVLGETSPANYFDTYWGPGLAVVGNAERAALARLKMYAQVGDRLKALRQQLPKRDHIRFDRHISALDMLQAELSPGAASTCQAPEPPSFSGSVEKMQLGKPKNKDLVSQWFKLIAASIRCDAGRVFGVQYGYEGHTGYAHGLVPSGITGNLHEMSHLANSDPQAEQLMIEFNAYFAKELKSFMDLLADIPEGDGTTALDNTLILWGTPLSDADQHSNRNIPFVLLGGGATNLNMGRYYNFGNWPSWKSDKDHGGLPHNHLLVTILHALGIDADHFGTTDVPAGNLDLALLSG